MARFIALLRGINVGGHAKVPMAELRTLCEGLGWQDVRTWIQSGNVVFEATAGAPALEKELEQALSARFGFAPAVIVRCAAAWQACVEDNPFPRESAKEPNRVQLGLAKARPKAGAAEALEARAAAGERVRAAGEALWFHYPSGAGTSKLTPALIDRLVGSPLTARNVRTVLKLGEMVG
jgi:uncharacterized protein (DUF1697 family)